MASSQSGHAKAAWLSHAAERSPSEIRCGGDLPRDLPKGGEPSVLSPLGLRSGLPACNSHVPNLTSSIDAAESLGRRDKLAPVGTFYAASSRMSEVLMEYDPIVSETDGRQWKPRACGRRGDGHMWEGWIEFVPLNRASAPVRSRRETMQPSRESLIYWATGLTPLYLRGALERARFEPAPQPPPRRVAPLFDGPAPEVEPGALAPGPQSACGPRSIRRVCPGRGHPDPPAGRARHRAAAGHRTGVRAAECGGH